MMTLLDLQPFCEIKGHTLPLWREIECDHGWEDEAGLHRCALGSGCSVGPSSFCVRGDCPLNDCENQTRSETCTNQH